MCTFSLDTGADSNIPPLSTFCVQTIKKEPLLESSTKSVTSSCSSSYLPIQKGAISTKRPNQNCCFNLSCELIPLRIFWCADTEHHDKSLRQLLDRKQNGYILSAEGLKPDQEKVKTMIYKAARMRFLGTLRYLFRTAP